MQKVKCDNCDISFLKKSYAIGVHNFCSHKCYSVWRCGNIKHNNEAKKKISEAAKQMWIDADDEKKKKMLTRNPNWKHKKESKPKLSQAAKERWVNPEYRAKFLKGKTITCDYCGIEFWKQPNAMRENNFCSFKCSSKWRKEIHLGLGRKMSNEAKEKIAKFAQERWKNLEYQEFMRNVCKGKKSSNWQGGISFLPYGHEFNNDLKIKIRDRDNHICQVCYKPEEFLGYTLHVHHTDSNKMNNHHINLISLCRNCHQKTKSNKEFWERYCNRTILKELT